MKRYKTYKECDDLWVKQIPSEWKFSEFKYYVDIISGYAFKSSDYSENIGVPIIRIGDINKSINLNSAKKANPKNIDELDRFIIQKGDLLLAMTGATIGKNVMFNSDDLAYINQRVGLLRSKENLNQHFLKYYIDTDFFKEFINLECAGSAQENISSSDIANFKICIPSLKEQTQIAHYLDHKTQIIDALIEKKELLVKKLELQRQAIINEAVTKGLNKNAKMKDSGIEWLGEIPEHWEVVKLKYLANEINTGKTPSTSVEEYFKDGEIDWFSPSDFNSIYLRKSLKKITQKAVDDLKIRLYPKNSILLIGIGATLGKVGIVETRCFSNQQINAISFNEKINPFYGLYFLDSIKEIIINESNASTMAILNQSKTKELLMLKPPLSEQIEIIEVINKKVKQLDLISNKTKQQIKKLKSYRQSIISEAVTGKIDVRNWEQNK